MSLLELRRDILLPDPRPTVVRVAQVAKPPVTANVRLDLVETGTFGSRVTYERYLPAGSIA